MSGVKSLLNLYDAEEGNDENNNDGSIPHRYQDGDSDDDSDSDSDSDCTDYETIADTTICPTVTSFYTCNEYDASVATRHRQQQQQQQQQQQGIKIKGNNSNRRNTSSKIKVGNDNNNIDNKSSRSDVDTITRVERSLFNIIDDQPGTAKTLIGRRCGQRQKFITAAGLPCNPSKINNKDNQNSFLPIAGTSDQNLYVQRVLRNEFKKDNNNSSSKNNNYNENNLSTMFQGCKFNDCCERTISQHTNNNNDTLDVKRHGREKEVEEEQRSTSSSITSLPPGEIQLSTTSVSAYRHNTNNHHHDPRHHHSMKPTSMLTVPAMVTSGSGDAAVAAIAAGMANANLDNIDDDNNNMVVDIDPALMEFLITKQNYLKVSPEMFHDWLLEQDIVSMMDLYDACQDEDFVSDEMRFGGLKAFKKKQFIKSVTDEIVITTTTAASTAASSRKGGAKKAKKAMKKNKKPSTMKSTNTPSTSEYGGSATTSHSYSCSHSSVRTDLT